jgi:DNA polymerase
VYDLKNAGPRNRFQAGGLVVHNCGYGGSDGAVERMALPLGVDFAAIGKTPHDIVVAYRAKYWKVKKFWYAVDDAFRTVLTSRRTSTVKVGPLTFRKHADRVEMILPSGRAITYLNARLETDGASFHSSGTSIVYDKALRKKVVACRTHGAKIVQNATEGFCRDLLAYVMLKARAAGAPIAFHVHDEMILEVLEQLGDQWRLWLQGAMRQGPEWAEGMPLFSLPTCMARYGK